MIFIKFLLVFLVGFTFLFLAHSQKFRDTNKFVLLVLFSIGIYFIIFPAQTDEIAQYFGIGKGTDLILYLSNAILLLLVAVLYAKSSTLSERITKIVRNRTIENGKKIDISKTTKSEENKLD